jgi:uncharacterized surface protein with fasciclin (FAS1) repeats
MMHRRVLHRDIIELMLADGRFSTFISSIRAARLEEMIMKEGPFTVFAPVDAAFSKVSRTLLNYCSMDPFRRLKNLVLNHIVEGNVLIPAARSLPRIISIQGDMLILEAGRWIRVNNARIFERNMVCGNGCIHSIDRLLIPDTIIKRSHRSLFHQPARSG